MPFEDLDEHITEIFGADSADHWRYRMALERWCAVRFEWDRQYQREWRRRPHARKARREYDRRPERRAAKRRQLARRDAEIAAIRAAAPRWNPAPPAPFTPGKLVR